MMKNLTLLYLACEHMVTEVGFSFNLLVDQLN